MSAFERDTRRRRSSRLAAKVLFAAIVLTATVGVLAAPAGADASNPIVGSSSGEKVTNPDGTVTVFVRGEWNWFTHNTDCNFDRPAAGVGIVWNDPTEPGYNVGASGVGVGTAALRPGDTKNVIDDMVHPADIGDFPPSKPGVQGQVFNDPPPNLQTISIVSATESGTIATLTTSQPHHFVVGEAIKVSSVSVGGYNQQATVLSVPTPTTLTYNTGKTGLGNGTGGSFVDPSLYQMWKGGCGVEPFSAHPAGSWGYNKVTPDANPQNPPHRGYFHTYAKGSDVTQICVNMYDAHGGGAAGSASFQVPGGLKEITVDQNSDNSIQTNNFNVQTSCISLSTLTTVHSITPNDTATLSGLTPGGTGTVSFALFGPFPVGTSPVNSCNGASVFAQTVTINGNGTYATANNGANAYVANSPGVWFWQVIYSGDINNTQQTSSCGTERCTVTNV